METETPKDYGIEYFGKLEEREILFLIEFLEEKVKNRETILGLGKLIRKLKEDFLIPEKIIEPTLKNKFVEVIEIQH